MGLTRRLKLYTAQPHSFSIPSHMTIVRNDCCFYLEDTLNAVVRRAVRTCCLRSANGFFSAVITTKTMFVAVETRDKRRSSQMCQWRQRAPSSERKPVLSGPGFEKAGWSCKRGVADKNGGPRMCRHLGEPAIRSPRDCRRRPFHPCPEKSPTDLACR